MYLPIAIGIIALIALAAAGGRSSSGSCLPPRARKRNPKALAFHTEVSVPWKEDKSGKQLCRIQIKETPTELRLAAQRKLGRPINESVYTLATMIASEEGQQPVSFKAAVGLAARNKALSQGLHIEELLIPDGSFGSEHGRYASTRMPPTIEEIRLAEGIMDGRIPDITLGSLHFDRPKVQLALQDQGASGYGPENTPEHVAANRAKANLVPFFIPQDTRQELRFWRKRAA